MSEIKNIISEKAKEIDCILEELLPREEGYCKTVIEAMNYSVRAGGKRLRPMMMSECYRLFAGDNESAVVKEILRLFMGAIECVHTYSLVHDDLPAMDNDMLRRGLPTTHAKYGEAMAILAGDALLNYAMELTTRAFGMARDDDIKRVAQAQRVIFDRSGIYGMIGGQTADVEAEKKRIAGSEELLSYIHRNKTGALIVASMLSGAILGGANEDDQAHVVSMAQLIGLAFQIQDDILDLEGDEDVLGKPIGSDERNEKLTYVLVHGIEKAKDDVVAFTKEAHDHLDSLPGDKSFLHGLFDELTQRES